MQEKEIKELLEKIAGLENANAALKAQVAELVAARLVYDAVAADNEVRQRKEEELREWIRVSSQQQMQHLPYPNVGAAQTQIQQNTQGTIPSVGSVGLGSVLKSFLGIE